MTGNSWKLFSQPDLLFKYTTVLPFCYLSGVLEDVSAGVGGVLHDAEEDGAEEQDEEEEEQGEQLELSEAGQPDLDSRTDAPQYSQSAPPPLR